MRYNANLTIGPYGPFEAANALPGGPRLIRPYPIGTGDLAAFIAVGDDGRALVAALREGSKVETREINPAGRIPQLAMGPVVPWQKAAPAAQLPPVQKPKTFGLNGNGKGKSNGKARPVQPVPPVPPPSPTSPPPSSSTMPPPLASVSCTQIGSMCLHLDAAVAVGRAGSSGKSGLSQPAAIEKVTRSLATALQDRSVTDTHILAYLLATIEHETAGAFRPIKQMGSAAFFEAQYGVQSNSGKMLGNTEAGDGARYAGRGYVQLVGRANYARVGKALGIDLEGNPDLMLEDDTSLKVLIAAALDGILTGRNLTQYLSSDTQDWFNARRVFNGADRSTQIAKRALQYFQALAGTGMPSAR